MRATCHVANTRVYLGFDTKGSRLRNFSLFIGDDTKYWIFLNGQFPFSFILFFVFLKQFFWDSWWKMKIADDWIWTADLWRLKQLLYQLRYNHCPLLGTGLWGYSTISGSSLVSTIIIGWLGSPQKLLDNPGNDTFIFLNPLITAEFFYMYRLLRYCLQRR